MTHDRKAPSGNPFAEAMSPTDRPYPVTDAHAHLQDDALAACRDAVLADLETIPVACCIVNATHEGDWDAVLALASRHPWMRPAYGVHPWKVSGIPGPSTLARLRQLLMSDTHASVGEIGLDGCAAASAGMAVQLEAFAAQWHVAAELGRAASVHCVRATGDLVRFLATAPVPSPGFLMHGFQGSWETACFLLDRGAHFSFNARFLAAGRGKLCAVYARLPVERLLVESDAPFGPLPTDLARYAIAKAPTLNHPGNVVVALDALANLRKTTPESLAPALASNLARLFG